MFSALTSFRMLADPTRLRLLALLERNELSVYELQEITKMGQSRISTHLGQLQQANLVHSRKEGKRAYYRLQSNEDPLGADFIRLALSGAKELEVYETDQLNLKYVLSRRKDTADILFSKVAGRFDRSYGPGRSWQAFGQLLLHLIPPIDVADLGSGEGLVSELLATQCRKVYAVDNSEKIIQFGQAMAEKNGLHNLEFRLGDLESPPLPEESVDLVILSQALHHANHPQQALQSVHGILRKGGKIAILDLLRHEFEEAKIKYGDTWLGFTEGELHYWLKAAGFDSIDISIVAREEKAPFFKTVLAMAIK